MKQYVKHLIAAFILSFVVLNTPCHDTALVQPRPYIAKQNKVMIDTVVELECEDGYSKQTRETNPQYIDLCVASYEEPEELIPEIDISEDEVILIALLTDAEAGGESEYGQRLVIDTILNRLTTDGFPKTVYGVINQPNQYSPVSSGRIWNRTLRDDLVQLVKEECMERTNKDVLFFRTDYYHDFGTPMFQVGAHYFSTL